MWTGVHQGELNERRKTAKWGQVFNLLGKKKSQGTRGGTAHSFMTKASRRTLVQRALERYPVGNTSKWNFLKEKLAHILRNAKAIKRTKRVVLTDPIFHLYNLETFLDTAAIDSPLASQKDKIDFHLLKFIRTSLTRHFMKLTIDVNIILKSLDTLKKRNERIKCSVIKLKGNS